ncbi:hypothetical protein SLEP1_g17495 [Rubroshorea leprosula]|uniref:RNase H type-1 domain-containing protein n=1 Tax=Rubroshorea leprosula TaxID=152421 RepID=A0AAV5IUH5_9ROSI|nr:hypothetical protein SLEP1_g17495 [Rubroshorea leprosula]
MPTSMLTLVIPLAPVIVLAPTLVFALALRDATWHVPWTRHTPFVCPWLQLRVTMPVTSAPELAALWDNKPVVPSQIIEKAVFFLTKYNAAISSKGRGAAGVQWMSETKWRPPAVGFTKVNVDGAIFEQQQLHGVGVVARNSIKEVLAAMISKGQGLLSVEETEACNLRKALKWAKDLMFNKIGMEMNCATCSKNWKNSSS